MPKPDNAGNQGNRGQERSAAARERARAEGSDAHGPGGNPNKGADEVDETTVDEGTTDTV